MGTATVGTANKGLSKSPPKPDTSPQRPDAASDAKVEQPGKNEAPSNAEAAKPLAPPPRPGQQQQQQQNGSNSPDYFSQQPGGGSLSLEPNPFEQSFGGSGQPETPGGTKLPSVHTLTSPSSLLPGSNATPFNWGGGSLRTGPLSPAMLSGPTNDYFGDTQHLRGGFPTPNESSLRSGLTPGGSGSMFPAPSPNSQAFIAQLASGGATPSTLDFHRTAMSAAAKRDQANGNPDQQTQQQQQQQQQQPQQQPQQGVTSQPQDMPNGAAQVKPEPKTFDPHDNDAANGLFMLAQGRNGTQNATQFTPAQAAQGQSAATSQPSAAANGDASGVARGVSEKSDDSEQPKPAARGKGKKNSAAATNGRRKAEDPAPAKAPPSKKAKSNIPASLDGSMSGDGSDDDDNIKMEDGGSKSKMTDEEKRKNFLERNRVAALKCRQRKKQWLANLQTKVEMFSNENEALTAQISQLREEVVNLKTLLLAHKDCPVTQQQGMHGAFMNQVAAPDPFNPQMNPYQMAGPMANQQVMAGQGVQRRFS